MLPTHTRRPLSITLSPLLAIIVTLALSTGACLDAGAGEVGTEQLPSSEDPNTDPDPDPKPNTDPPVTSDAEITLTYVSGHLGNYWDCPGQGAKLPTSAKADAPAAGEAGPGAPCAEDDEDCSDSNWGPLNCEDATVTLRVDNIGTVLTTGVKITELTLLNDQGNVIMDLEILDQGPIQRFDWDGELTAGSDVTLMVTYTGPSDLNWDDAYKLRIKVETKEGADGELDTPELFSLPAIAT